MLFAIVAAIYGLFVFVALTNLLLMRRPGQPNPKTVATVCVLIPARDEAHNIGRLITALKTPNPDLKVYVYDDESSDGTGTLAASAGATVVRPREALPPGWTGKTRACHELALAASEDSDAEWLLYLDADVHPEPDFIPRMATFAAEQPRSIGAISGFPTILSGAGIEPLFLGWVGWILLASNPFGIVSRTGKGHNRFTNGQIQMYRQEIYTELWLHKSVRGAVLEDVKIGRLLCNKGVRVEIANLSEILKVKMYETWRETLDGMSKNSFEVTGSAGGTIGISALFVWLAWSWAFVGPHWYVPLLLLSLSGLFVALTARATLWMTFTMPIILSIGAFTMMRSLVWHRRGAVTWKGRTYPGERKI